MLVGLLVGLDGSRRGDLQHHMRPRSRPMTTGVWPAPRRTPRTSPANSAPSDRSHKARPIRWRAPRITTDKDGKQTDRLHAALWRGAGSGHGPASRQGSGEGLSVSHLQQIGCIATAPFDDDAGGLAEGRRPMRSLMFASLDGKPVGVPMSFKGYQQSLTRLEKRRCQAPFLVLETVVVKIAHCSDGRRRGRSAASGAALAQAPADAGALPAAPAPMSRPWATGSCAAFP